MREIVSPLDGIRSPFGFIRGGGVVPFSPSTLFASGEEGAWYEPSTTTAFRSTTDLTPCGYGQSAGFLLDLSKGAGYSGGSFTGLGSELRGGGSPAKVGTATTATYNTSTGEAVVYRVDFSNQSYITVPATTGIKYLISVTNTGAVDAVVWARAFPFAGTEFVVVPAGQSSVCYLSAADSGLAFSSATSGGTAAEFTINSVAELPGNHATQGTESARPILARVPETGRRNLLERTEDIANAWWTKGNATVSSDGTGQKITENTATDAHFIQTTSLGADATAHTIQFEAQPGGRDYICVQFSGTSVSGTTADRRIWFNVNTGSVGTTGASWSNASVTSVGGGWYRCEATITRSGSSNFFLFLTASGDNVASYTGDGSSGVYFRKAQLETGSSATAYQRVSSQYDITEAGVTSLEYLAFDGSDDGMATASIDFTATDKMSVFAGVENINASSYSVLVELGSISVGGFVWHPDTSLSDQLAIINPGVSGNRSGALFPQPATASSHVGAALFDRAGTDFSSEISYRRNGLTESGTLFSDYTNSTGNYGDYPLYLGARAGTSLFFNGKLFSLIVRGAASTAQEISDTETYLAAKSGVTL